MAATTPDSTRPPPAPDAARAVAAALEAGDEAAARRRSLDTARKRRMRARLEGSNEMPNLIPVLTVTLDHLLAAADLRAAPLDVWRVACASAAGDLDDAAALGHAALEPEMAATVLLACGPGTVTIYDTLDCAAARFRTGGEGSLANYGVVQIDEWEESRIALEAGAWRGKRPVDRWPDRLRNIVEAARRAGADLDEELRAGLESAVPS